MEPGVNEEPWVQWGGGVRGGWGWGLEVWKGGVCGGGGWGWGSHDARSKAHDKRGRRGRVRAGWGGLRVEWSSSRDEEWDQEPWVHEKHGGVRGGLGQGESMRSGKGGWAGSGCVGGGGRGGGEPWGQEPWVHEGAGSMRGRSREWRVGAWAKGE